jgi:hypothetical protein
VLVFLASNALRKRVYSTRGRDPLQASHWILPESNPVYQETLARRVAQFTNECTIKHVEGDHHLHMDASADEISRDILTFMERAHQLQQHATIQPTPHVKNSLFLSQPKAKL